MTMNVANTIKALKDTGHKLSLDAAKSKVALTDHQRSTIPKALLQAIEVNHRDLVTRLLFQEAIRFLDAQMDSNESENPSPPEELRTKAAKCFTDRALENGLWTEWDDLQLPEFKERLRDCTRQSVALVRLLQNRDTPEKPSKIRSPASEAPNTSAEETQPSLLEA